MHSVIFKREASTELAAAAGWYEASTEGVGTAFVEEVDAAVRTIVESPTRWPRWPKAPKDSHLRRFLLARFPYAIAYRADSHRVVIFAIAHTRKRPDYWFGRAR